MSEPFIVTVKATSISVYPGAEAMVMLQPLIDMLTYEDEFVEEERTLGFLYDSDTDILYLHKGVDLNYLKDLAAKMEKFEQNYPQSSYGSWVEKVHQHLLDVIGDLPGSLDYTVNRLYTGGIGFEAWYSA